MSAGLLQACMRQWSRLAPVGAALVSFGALSGCGDFLGLKEAFTNPCATNGCVPPPQDCASLSSASWAVEGFTPSTIEVAQGMSKRVLLWPIVEAQCETFVSSVTWRVDDPSIASIAPRKDSAWITGVAPGLTSVGARVVLGDGITREAQAESVRIVARSPAGGGQLVSEGSLTIAPYIPPGNTTVWSVWVPFTTPVAGRIDVLVDWVSPLNGIDFSGYERHCNSIGSCGTIRMIGRQSNVKPLASTFDSPRSPAGEYTIRIDNLGPGEETVRYEVRLTPS